MGRGCGLPQYGVIVNCYLQSVNFMKFTCIFLSNHKQTKTNSVVFSCKRTIPTERPTLIGDFLRQLLRIVVLRGQRGR
jgi:predicted nucleotide-binding protein (sugar kinase/HSP70/actin superfamily)